MVDQYWAAVQNRVCVKCIDGDRHGNCRLAPQFECALKAYFPGVVRVVKSTSSENVLDYVAALRKEVCAQCREQSLDGRCYVRSMLDCALDRYFPRIIEAIEGVRA